MSDETVNETEAEETEETEEAAPVEEAAQEAVVPEVEEVDGQADAEAEALEESEPTEAADEAPAAEAPAEEAPAEAVAPAAPVRKKKQKRLPRPLRRQRTKAKREKPAERKPIVLQPKPEHVRGRRKERRGVVVSAAMDKTIVVRVDTVKPHPVYKKIVRHSTRLRAHDEGNTAKPGDLVRLVETRPLSKSKHWRLAEVLEEAK